MDQPKDPPPCPVLASNWKVLPSRGTEAHSVLLLKTSLALYGGEGLQMAKRKINGEQENEVSKDSKRQSRIKSISHRKYTEYTELFNDDNTTNNRK